MVPLLEKWPHVKCRGRNTSRQGAQMRNDIRRAQSGVCDSTRIKIWAKAQWSLSRLQLLFEGG